MSAMETQAKSPAQHVVLPLALREQTPQRVGAHIVQHLRNGLHAHFHPGVTLAQQLHGILFDHVVSVLS